MDIEWLARASVPAEPDSPREQWGESAAWSEDSVRERDFAKSRRSATRRLRVPDLPAGTQPNRIQVQPAARAQSPAEISTALEMTDRGLVLSANYPHGTRPLARKQQDTLSLLSTKLENDVGMFTERGRHPCWPCVLAVTGCAAMRCNVALHFRTMNSGGDSA